MTPADFIREKLAEIKARCEKAKLPPWRAELRGNCSGNSYHTGPGPFDWMAVTSYSDEDDCKFIAASRTDLPALVAFAEELLAYDQNPHAVENAARKLGWEADRG